VNGLGGSFGAGGGAAGTVTVPPGALPGLTFYGCGSQDIVGAWNGHGVAFTMGTTDLQPLYPFATSPILRGAAARGNMGDQGYISTNISGTLATTVDLFAGFSTYFGVLQSPSNSYYFYVGQGGTIVNGYSNTLMTSPTTKDLHAVDGILGSEAWAVGADATIIHWNGSWQLGTHPEEPGITLRGVSVAAANDVWAVGDSGHALHWDGSTWTTVATGTTVNLNAIVHGPVQSGVFTNFFAVGDAGTVLKFNGISWSAVSSPTTAPLYAACSSTKGLTIGGQGGAYWSSFTNLGWTAYPLNLGIPSTTPAIGAVGATDVWAAFSAGTTSQLFHYDGSAWTNMSFLQSPNVSHVLTSPGGAVWFYGSNGGQKWKAGSFQPAPQSLFGDGPSTAVSDDEIFLVSTVAGTVTHLTATSGTSNGGPPTTVVDITSTAPNDVWALGAGIWQWDGTTWTSRPITTPTGTVGAFQHIRKTSSGVWILAEKQLLRWTGTVLDQWALPAAVTATLKPAAQIHFIPVRDDDVWLTGPWGAYQFDGTNWTQRSTAQILDMAGDATRIWGVTASTIVSFAP